MLEYLITIILSISFCIFSEKKIIKPKHKRVAIFLSIMAVLIPCVLAGLREPGVGIDSGTYAYTDFMVAKRYNAFSTYYLHSAVKEILYPVLVYVSSRVTDSFFVLFFISQVLIIAPVYATLYLIKKRRPDFSMIISYAAFLFLYYNLSLSIIRQCMATSFVVLGYTIYKLNKKYKKSSIILFVLAVLSHSTAIVLILSIILLDWIINDQKKEIWKKMLIIAAIMVVVLNIQNIVLLAAKFLPSLMARYIDTFNTIDRSGLSNGDTLMKLVFFIMCLLGTKRDTGKNEMLLSSYTFIGAIGIIFQFVSIFSEYLIRISYYFQFFMIIPIGLVHTAFSKESKQWVKIGTVLLLFAYWYIVYVSWGWHGTVPFKFAAN